MKNKIFTVAGILFVIVFGYILSIACSKCSVAFLSQPLLTTIVLIIFLFLLFVFLYFWAYIRNLKPIVFLTGLGIIAFALRFSWICDVKTDIHSDFAGYFNYAAEIARGNAWHPNHLYELFPFTTGYPLVLSIWFKIFGSGLFTGKLLNILCSLVLLILIYATVNCIFSRSAAYMACTIFTFWPAQIMYSSVMATEHVFIVFFMLGVYLAVLIRRSEGWRQFLFSIILGLTVLMTQLLRPIAFVLIPSIFVYLLMFLEAGGGRGKVRARKTAVCGVIKSIGRKTAVCGVIKGIGRKTEVCGAIKGIGRKTAVCGVIKSIGRKTAVCGVILVCYLLGQLALRYMVLDLTGVDISKSSPGFNLLIGTNSEQGGVWNAEDAAIIEEFDRNPEVVQREAMKRGIERIFNNPVGFLKFALQTKVNNMWAHEGYGYYWSTKRLLAKGSFFEFVQRNNKLILAADQTFYILVLAFSVVGCIFAILRKNGDSLPVMLVALCIFGAHLFLEVQVRYAFPAIPLLMVMAGYGGNEVRDVVVGVLSRRDVTGEHKAAGAG